MPAVILQVKAADVVPVDQDAALLKFIETRDELGDRGLARAGMPHDRQVLARADLQVETRRGPVRSPYNEKPHS